ncbi:rhodanese-like domain-containing protein [Actinopolyspora mortivallis]|uniref:rhodanese-like domain-containing protein n=1 Tax=Actinopolyspora mortivallis TaxID=33906 RepID=UPI000373A233|nr:rhodanese-like domain-containing protein [Actinopolyspora mortivallis]
MSFEDGSVLDTPEARALLDDNPTVRVVDVRTPGEFTAVRVPGSYNVPLRLLREHAEDLRVEHRDPVLLVCSSGERAEQARGLLEGTGLERLAVLRGGVNSWREHGAPLRRSSGGWEMERQVRLVAGSLVLVGVLGSLVHRPMKWVAGFVGAGLTFAALSDTCPMARLLALLPHNRTGERSPGVGLDALTAPRPPAELRG